MSETKSETLPLIEEALSSIHDEVWYGMVMRLPAASPWNYTVFWRDSTSVSPNLTSKVDRFSVMVVRENFVPEAELGRVVEAMRGIPGMKLDAGSAVEYGYGTKPDSSDVIESMTVKFVRGSK